MRVLVQPADAGPCGTYRLAFPAWALQAQGFDVALDRRGVKVLSDTDWEGDQPPPEAKILGLHEVPEADVVVWQRPARMWMADVVPMLQAAGVRVVIDVDDRFDQIPKGNMAWRPLQPHPSRPHRDWTHIARACELADLVTTTTPELAARFGYGHGVVLDNLVPEHYLGYNPPKLPHTLGWAGAMTTHPGDLEVTGGALGGVLSPDWRFRVVGPPDGVRKALRLAAEPSATGWVPLDEYPKRVAELEVGVAPLADNVFNWAKSHLKLAEYAALGVPFVASDLGDYRRFHKLTGLGELASSPGQWRRKVQALTRNDPYRKEVAGKGREVMANWTYERHAERWWDAWTSVVS